MFLPYAATERQAVRPGKHNIKYYKVGLAGFDHNRNFVTLCNNR